MERRDLAGCEFASFGINYRELVCMCVIIPYEPTAHAALHAVGPFAESTYPNAVCVILRKELPNRACFPGLSLSLVLVS
jgi:hypothetical protein